MNTPRLQLLIAEFHLSTWPEGEMSVIELKKFNDTYRVFHYHSGNFLKPGSIDSKFDCKEEAINYIEERFKPVHAIMYDEGFEESCV